MDIPNLLLEYSAEVEDDFIRITRKFLEGIVRHKIHHDIRLLEGFQIRRQLEYLVLRHIRFHNKDVRIVAAFHHFRHDVLVLPR